MRWTPRFVLVVVMAVSVSLPMAWISLAKLLLFVGCLVVLLTKPKRLHEDIARLTSMQFFVPAMAALALCMLSLLWTSTPLDIALASLVKHARLLVIVLLILMLRTAKECRWAVLALSIGFALQLLVSWLSAYGMPTPWMIEWRPRGVVFTSYLDQSIIFSTCAAVWWHLSPAKTWRKWASLGLVIAALANALFLMTGRTGYLIALTLVALAAMWRTPHRFRWQIFLLIPLIAVSSALAFSNQFKDRLILAGSELMAYSSQGDTITSTGWRLNAWHRSVQAIQERPLFGHGVGGFTSSVKRLQGADANTVFGPGKLSNPHQEFLLWGVEMGIAGMAVLFALLAGVFLDFNRMPLPVQRAGLSVLAALVIACSFNSSLYDGLIGDFFVTLLGLLLALGSLSKPVNAT